MRVKNWMILMIAIGILSCKKKGCTDERATNFTADAKKNDGTCIYPPIDSSSKPIVVPTTYSFLRDGKSTVNFEGQTQRMDMLSEWLEYIKKANTPGTALSSDKMKDYFANTNSPFANAFLNSIDKRLKDKVVVDNSSTAFDFNAIIDSLAAISSRTKTGEFTGKKDTTGVIQSGTKQYLFDGNGVELKELIEKGIMSAVFLYQISHGYLGEEKMNVENTNLESGQNYTKMEHHWDEAFGYFSEAIDFPAGGTSRFWGKYCNGRNGVLGTNKTLMDAFLTGRTAIVNKDYTKRDEQIAIINKTLAMVAAGTAIHYINGAKKDIADDALRNHQLSEALGLIKGLQYLKGNSMSSAEVKQVLSYLGGGNHYLVSPTDLDNAVTLIANKYKLDDKKSEL